MKNVILTPLPHEHYLEEIHARFAQTAKLTQRRLARVDAGRLVGPFHDAVTTKQQHQTEYLPQTDDDAARVVRCTKLLMRSE